MWYIRLGISIYKTGGIGCQMDVMVTILGREQLEVFATKIHAVKMAKIRVSFGFFAVGLKVEYPVFFIYFFLVKKESSFKCNNIILYLVIIYLFPLKKEKKLDNYKS